MRIHRIMENMDRLYPQAACSLSWRDPLELLVSTQLSAQCTDARVNTVTPVLFERYRTAEDFARADQRELEALIHSLGFFRNKAANIIACCQRLVTVFKGRAPDNLEDMLSLPGVGRKTANLVLWEIYGIPGVVVDTHAARIAGRLGLTKATAPTLIEQDLMRVLPKEKWGSFSHQMVMHGRALCMARKPDCNHCLLAPDCDHYFNSSR